MDEGNIKGQPDNKPLDYFGILSRSFTIVKKHKYLWFLGILAGAFGSTMNFRGYNTGSDSTSTLSNSEEQFLNTIFSWVQSHVALVAAIVGIVIILSIVFLVVSIIARAGLINSADKSDKGEESSFGQAMKFGWHKFWRVLGIDILLGLLAFGMILAVVIPAILLAIIQVWPLFALYLVPAVLFVIFLIVAVGIVSKYALRFAVIADDGVSPSLGNGYKLLKEKKKESSLLFLMNILISIISGVAVIVAVIALILVLGLLGLLLWIVSSNMVVIVVYAIPATLFSIVIMALISGFFVALTETYWTLAFKDITE